MGWEYTEFRREKLYERVWTEPLTTIAKHYGISDVGLKKICAKLGIPLPGRGHWAKLAAGHTLQRTPLPPTTGATTYRRSRYTPSRDEAFDTRLQDSLQKDLPPSVPKLPIRTSIDDCLPLVKKIATKLNGKRRDMRGWQMCEGPGLMSVTASPENCLRATLLLNLLLESLLGSGYSISSGTNATEPASVTIVDCRLSFKVRERSRREAIVLTRQQREENERLGFQWNSQRYEYHTTGSFDISATPSNSGYEWAKISNSPSAAVETKIAAFIVRLRELAIQRRVQSEINEERRIVAEAKAAEERRQAEIRRVELERLKLVEEWSGKYERANRLRNLADVFEAKKLTSSDRVVDAGWIRRAADWLDPTVSFHWDDVDEPSESDQNS
ncbi:hypothetical protein [Paraburkholderia silvatlantica]|uniref:Uncharacterized protein n=1 Tax=Paraburkholderia silvatlantica TaxID=321895 RepID=A0ABR6FWX2_9BURK|nr:hypothetical protein [Paraburkholderia silvatlantica]MBB2931275.1 hypothetical protein [Paraburkholderia silvatlantica]PVY28287.1 hypothetical protein C7411_11796 [Paraburkholderia silvatlantica]PXW34972.1 hypothetical protein C7413_11696 [Paraburkholderia silvatlantica]TDQ98879.1 hypothetical protein C7412_10496 [Paraburkholderia silvatlantica]